MNNIIRFWNQNRKGIIAGAVAIVLLIIFIQVLNQIAKDQNQKEDNTNLIIDENLPTESIIGGKTLTQEQSKKHVEIIEEFTNKCNDGDIVGAYQMLTKECKEELFKTEENFRKGYYNLIFNGKKIVNIENFISINNRYTYRVKFYDDMLATGNVDDAQSSQDYITIDENSQNGIININSFIYKREINKEVEENGIKVSVISQITYKDHEDYEIKIQNNTENTISIDSRQKSKSIYILGNNNVKYSSNINEISTALYEILANSYRTYKIKFNKAYSTNIQTNGIIFSDMVPNYDEYKLNKQQVTDRVQIGVSI